jgi:hypothetical protein
LLLLDFATEALGREVYPMIQGWPRLPDYEILAPIYAYALGPQSQADTFAGMCWDADLADVDLLADVGFPGEPPFVRGVQPNMYRGRLWTMRQYAGFGTAEESNRRYRYLLEKGQTGLSVAFDLPTQMGRDSDHPMSLGEVGKVGVAQVTQVISISQVTWLQYSETLLVGSSLVLLQVMQAQ